MVDLADFARPGSGGDRFVMIGFAKPVFKPESGGDRFVMSGFARPESGRFVFVERVRVLCLPSGVKLCTSERVWRQCVACAIDAPALRFRDTSLVTSLVVSHECSYENSS